MAISGNNQTGSWWRHQMETFSALVALCAGNSLVTDEFPSQRPVARSFDVCLLFICALTNGWTKNRDGGDLRLRCVQSDVIVMLVTYPGDSPRSYIWHGCAKITHCLVREVCPWCDLLGSSRPQVASWPLFTKQTDVLPQLLVKSRSREIRV